MSTVTAEVKPPTALNLADAADDEEVIQAFIAAPGQYRQFGRENDRPVA